MKHPKSRKSLLDAKMRRFVVLGGGWTIWSTCRSTPASVWCTFGWDLRPFFFYDWKGLESGMRVLWNRNTTQQEENVFLDTQAIGIAIPPSISSTVDDKKCCFHNKSRKNPKRVSIFKMFLFFCRKTEKGTASKEWGVFRPTNRLSPCCERRNFFPQMKISHPSFL